MLRIPFICLFISGFSLQAQLIPLRINDLWGYSDTSGKVRIKPEYDFCDFFSGELAFVKKDSFYYVIDTLNNFQNTPYKRYGNFVNGLCPVQTSAGKSHYIDSKGKHVFESEFDAAENFSEGLAVVSVGNKLGIINSNGDWIRKPDFDTSSQYFKSGFLMGISRGKYFYIDRKGQTLNLPDSVMPASIFSEGLAAVYVKKSYNSEGVAVETSFLEFIDSSGRIVLSGFDIEGINYSEYLAIEKEFRDGKAILKTRNALGWDYYFMDKNKRFSPLYASARHLGDSLYLGAIGYYMSDIRIIDKDYFVSGQFQHKPTQVGEFGNKLLPFRDNEGNWGYVDANCNLIIKNKYSMAFNFKNGYAFVILNGKLGVINSRGREYFYDKN